MAISAGQIITAADIATVATNINTTLTTYGIATETNDMTQNTIIKAARLRAMIAKLQQADANSHHITVNDRSTQLSTVLTEINVNNLIKASSITTLQEASTHLNSHYCSCNCNYCSCRCDRCSCDCNRCSCNCNRCSCNCNRRHYCTIGSMHTCFVEDTIIFTSQGPKKVQELQIGDAILTINGTYDLIESVWNIPAENQLVVNYIGDNFDITLTKDHLIPITPDNEILYLQDIQYKNELYLRNGQEYPKLLIENLPFIISNIYNITSTKAYFYYSESLINLLSQIITDDFNYVINGNIVEIIGKIGEFNFVNYLQSCKNNQNEVIFPYWIYSINKYYVNKYFQFITNTNTNFSNKQLLQLKLLFNSHNLNCKIENNQLVFNINNNNKIIKSEEKFYTGYLYNFKCETQRFIAGEIIIGDGYV